MGNCSKVEVLNTCLWGLKEIMVFTGYKSKTTAMEVKKRVLKECGGAFRSKVKRDAVLKYYGTTKERELGYEKKENEF